MNLAGELVSATMARVEKLQHLQAREWAGAALVAAVSSTPGRGDTKWATGRARGSTWTSNNTPSGYDPGPGRSVYRIPTMGRALFGIRGRKPADDVVLNQGVPYDWNVEKHHHPITTGHRVGLAELRDRNADHIRKATAGRKRVVIRLT